MSLVECPNLSVTFHTHSDFYMAQLSTYGMVSVTLSRSLVSTLPRYFVCCTPQSVTDLLKYLHYSWWFSCSTESFRTYKAMLLSWWDWQPWQYLSDTQHNYFPSFKGCSSNNTPLQWHMASIVSSCQHFCCTILGFKQPKKFVCSFSWCCNPLWLYFHSPVAGFNLLVFEVSWSHTTTRHSW